MKKTIKEKYRYIDYRGEKIKVTEKKYREIMQQVKEYVENEILDNTMRLNEIDYLDLLLKYESLESQEQLIWQK